MNTTIVKENRYVFWGFGIHKLETKKEGSGAIKGGSLILFNRILLTAAVSKAGWFDDEGNRYKVKMDGGILFVKNVAISW